MAKHVRMALGGGVQQHRDSIASMHSTIFCPLGNLAISPIQINRLVPWLERYPHAQAARELQQGFTEGFRLGYSGPRQAREANNHKSAARQPDVVTQKLLKEVDKGRVAGPFTCKPLPELIVSPIGLVEKSSPGEFRLIFDLSHPHARSVNDGIPAEVSSVEYTGFDAVTDMIRNLGQGVFLVKLDIESAFRLLPVHPDDFSLLGMQHQGRYFVDKALPFGCASSCAIFEKFSTFLEWGARTSSGSTNLIHYLDDFCGGEKSHEEAKALLDNTLSFFHHLGVPVAPDKVEGPSTCLKFLGLMVDTVAMEIRIPEEKVRVMHAQVELILGARKVTLRELQVLLGRLNFACRAVVPGRPFCRRLIDATKGVKRQHHRIRVTQSMKQDLLMWDEFLRDYNGRSIILPSEWADSDELQLYTDASGSIGFGAFFKGHWVQGAWPAHWGIGRFDITFKELYPIVLAVQLWSHLLKNRKVVFYCDNQAVVAIINKQTSKSPNTMCLVRILVLACMQNNLLFRAKHLPGKVNNIADALSRAQFDRFRRLAPAADNHPTPIPNTLRLLLEGK